MGKVIGGLFAIIAAAVGSIIGVWVDKRSCQIWCIYNMSPIGYDVFYCA